MNMGNLVTTGTRTDLVDDALQHGRIVCPLLGRACVADGCAWFLTYGEDDCAMAVVAYELEGVHTATHNIASCM